jgi:hypothetical protein
VRPFYVESNQVRIPELKKVIAFFESNVAIADTLEQALTQLLGEVPNLDEVVDEDGEIVEVPDDPSAPIDPDDQTGTVDERAARLLEDANALFEDAEAALAAGDLGEYQTLTEDAQELVSEALQLLAASTTTTSTPPGEEAPLTSEVEEPTDEESEEA